MTNYTIKSGESLFKLWREKYTNKISWDEFKNFVLKNNVIEDINNISAGQKILIPDININSGKKKKIFIGFTIIGVAVGTFFIIKKFKV